MSVEMKQGLFCVKSKIKVTLKPNLSKHVLDRPSLNMTEGNVNEFLLFRQEAPATNMEAAKCCWQ